MRFLIAFLVVVAVLSGAGVLAARYFKPAASELPTIEVHRGDFLVKTHVRGDLRSVNSAMIAAPSIGGGLLISQMASMGAVVQKDDVVLAFDPAEQQNHLETQKSRLDEAEQEITKIRADSAVREQADKVELMKAEFAVRRAELDVSRNELVSEIDARKNVLTLEAAQKKLAQLRQDVQSRQKSSDAELAMAKEKYNKAAIEMKQAQRRIDQITIKSPISGLVSVRPNRFASNMWFPGIDVPDYRTGDQAFGGDTVLEVVNTEQLEVLGKVSETDRGNLKEGQDVLIRLDGLPNDPASGKVKSLAGMASRPFFGESIKTFDVVFTCTKQDPRMRPGMSADIEIITERIRDAVFVPAQAVFDKEGKKWVYVHANNRFQRREVTPGRRSESQVMIGKGVAAGEHVALLDPEARATTGRRNRNPLGRSGAAGAVGR